MKKDIYAMCEDIDLHNGILTCRNIVTGDLIEVKEECPSLEGDCGFYHCYVEKKEDGSYVKVNGYPPVDWWCIYEAHNSIQLSEYTTRITSDKFHMFHVGDSLSKVGNYMDATARTVRFESEKWFDARADLENYGCFIYVAYYNGNPIGFRQMKTTRLALCGIDVKLSTPKNAILHLHYIDPHKGVTSHIEIDRSKDNIQVLGKNRTTGDMRELNMAVCAVTRIPDSSYIVEPFDNFTERNWELLRIVNAHRVGDRGLIYVTDEKGREYKTKYRRSMIPFDKLDTVDLTHDKCLTRALGGEECAAFMFYGGVITLVDKLYVPNWDKRFTRR